MKHLKEKKKLEDTKKYWYSATITELHGAFKQVVMSIDDEVFVRTERDRVLVFDGQNISFLTDKSTARKSMTKPEKISDEENSKIEIKYKRS